MDCTKNADSFPETPLVFLAFLQHKSCQHNDLDDLNENLKWTTNHNYIESDEELQTDGHSFTDDYRHLLQDLQQQVRPHLPGITWGDLDLLQSKNVPIYAKAPSIIPI